MAEGRNFGPTPKHPKETRDDARKSAMQVCGYRDHAAVRTERQRIYGGAGVQGLSLSCE
jgi:hypothetical protein